MFNLYWGDLHNHCSISYGHGTVEQAVLRAAQQLDFCSVTGHAFWPDMPTDRSQYAEIIDYHHSGFANLAHNWDQLVAMQAQLGSEDGRFICFPSYEWHSLKYGDHNVYAPGPELPLRDAPDLPALREVARAAGAIAIPHHIGYKAGFRGIDWQHFKEDLSPFVEVFSLHGCSVSPYAPYPMLHDMGPRDAGSTAEAGWQMGHRFGIVGGTDHHGAYPGSHGDGRQGVFAESNTRQGLWQAFKERRVFAATGDNIDARLFVDDAWIGSTIQQGGTRHLAARVTGMDALDKVVIYKNGRPVTYLHPTVAPPADQYHGRLRVTWGWGRKDDLSQWAGKLSLSEGRVIGCDTCFSGQAVVAPQSEEDGPMANPDAVDLPHELLDWDERSVTWRSVTMGNPTMRHPATQALSLEIDAPASATVSVEVNDQKLQYPLSQLLRAGRTHYMRGWLSEAICVGPLSPVGDCVVDAEWTDEPENDVDYYRLEAVQLNGQCAWLTPIWVER